MTKHLIRYTDDYPIVSMTSVHVLGVVGPISYLYEELCKACRRSVVVFVKETVTYEVTPHDETEEKALVELMSRLSAHEVL